MVKKVQHLWIKSDVAKRLTEIIFNVFKPDKAFWKRIDQSLKRSKDAKGYNIRKVTNVKTLD